MSPPGRPGALPRGRQAALRWEELTAPALEALDRRRTLVLLAVSPLEHHGPHLPVGVDLLAARHFCEALAEGLAARRPDWVSVLAPTLPIGSWAFDATGTLAVRQRAVRDVVADYGRALARAGFRHVVVASGHAGPGHLVALDEAAALVGRRHGIAMASLTGHLAWAFLRGRFVPQIEAALGRSFTPEERAALADDAHAGWWETSLMLLLHPDLVDPAYRELAPARYPLPARLVPNFPHRRGGQGYVGEPARADLAFARAVLDVLLEEALAAVERLLDGRPDHRVPRSPFWRLPFLRTDFWPVAGTALAALAAGLWLARARDSRAPAARSSLDQGAAPR
jgi:creatinine amidohydrolase